MRPRPQDEGRWDRLMARLDSPEGFLKLVAFLIVVLLLALSFSSPGNVKDTVTALAILVGGGWTLYQFALRKSFESCLAIDVGVFTTPHGAGFATYIDVTLQNTGNRRIVASKQLTPEQIASYEDSVVFPGDLQLRRVADGANGFVDWWSSKQHLAPVLEVPEHVSLLDEYTGRDGKIDFFMEPSERYNVGALFILSEGNYLAKVVFVGSRTSASEYWSRFVSFRVPMMASQ